MENVCKYPIVLVHGMFGWGDDEGINDRLPYWGANTCNIEQHYTELGYKVYAASVGPVSSAWDRACELYARLTGGVVDYGKVHSEKSNHRRYGRFYDKPLVKEWDKDHKIHLVGHSFGGNAIRLLAYLLTYGCPEEVEGTEENVSELFKGGHEELIASVTTICSPHNGTTTFLVADKLKILPVMKFIAYNYIGFFGRSPAEGTIFDFHLEQYGMSDTPGKKDAYPLRRAKKAFNHNKDNCEYDMCPEGAKKLNDLIEISPNIYYFSYSYNDVSSNFTGSVHVAGNCNFPFLTYTSTLVLIYNRFFKKDKNLKYEDYCNDGLVDLTSALHPDDEPHIRFNSDDIKPGIWNVMKPRIGDHGTPIGLLAPVEDTFKLYDSMFKHLYDVEQLIEN
jgi:triacylglycerol lipase